jgi:hypothetical protein
MPEDYQPAPTDREPGELPAAAAPDDEVTPAPTLSSSGLPTRSLTGFDETSPEVQQAVSAGQASANLDQTLSVAGEEEVSSSTVLDPAAATGPP